MCLVEFLNMFLWVAKHPETGKCAFSKFSCFLSFQIFPPLTPLYQSANSPGLEVSFIFGLQCECDSDCTQVWWSVIIDPRRRCSSEADQGIFIFAELCSIRVLVTTPKLILLTQTFRMVGFVAFPES